MMPEAIKIFSILAVLTSIGGTVSAQEQSLAPAVAADRPFDCFDRCTEQANQCMGVEPRGGPLMPLEPDPDGGVVPTPAPVEFCLAVLQECNAQCSSVVLRGIR